MNEQFNGTRAYLLAPEEEAALARLREIVERLRAKQTLVEVASMEDDIRAAGGRRVHSPEPGGPDTFVLGCARFSLRPSTSDRGKIEVLFLPDPPVRYLMFYLAAASVGLSSDPRGDSWASVPASREASQVDAFSVPREPTEDVVALVGRGAAGNAGPLHPVPVVGFDLGPLDGGPSGSVELEHEAIPADTVWPGPDGRISVQLAPTTGPDKSPGLRNPWEIRIRPAPELRVFTFASGGVIGGGGGGPVALLNGRVARRGTSIDGFEVVQVTPAATVLRMGGLFYAVPLGRRISIETAAN